MMDASVGLIQTLTTALTSSTTSTARAYFNAGGPLDPLYANFDVANLALATAGTLTMTFTPQVLLSNDGTTYRVAYSGTPVTATTTVQSGFPMTVRFAVPAAEPYVKIGIFGSTATNAVTPYCTFYGWIESATNRPVY